METLYVISVAAELAGMHPQTLRQYDRIGLVIPKRTKGRGRRYSAEDIAELREIQRLSQEEGINLAGIKRLLECVMRAGPPLKGLRNPGAGGRPFLQKARRACRKGSAPGVFDVFAPYSRGWLVCLLMRYSLILSRASSRWRRFTRSASSTLPVSRQWTTVVCSTSDSRKRRFDSSE